MNVLYMFDLITTNEISFVDLNSMKKSIFGFILTIVVTFIYIILNYIVVLSFFKSKTSIVLQSQLVRSNYSEISISDYNVSFNLADQYGYPIDENILRMSLYLNFYKGQELISTELEKSKNCSVNNFLQESIYNQTYCFSDIKNKTYGYWDTWDVIYLSLHVDICDINENKNCKSIDEISSYLLSRDLYIQFSLPIMKIQDNS